MSTYYQGCCYEFLPRLAEQSVDLILSDFPYGTTQAECDRKLDLGVIWAHFQRVLKPRGNVVLFASQPFTTELVNSNPRWFRYADVWDKRLPCGSLNCRRRTLRVHEDILVFYPKPGTYNPQMRTGVHRKKGGGGTKDSPAYGKADAVSNHNDQYYPTSIWSFSNADLRNKLHPFQKPLDLCRALIRTYSNPGDVVLDPCMGVGSTLLAAKLEDRIGYGCELDPGFYDVAMRRLGVNAEVLA